MPVVLPMSASGRSHLGNPGFISSESLMKMQNDISNKNFLVRIISGMIVFSVISIIYANLFIPEMRGFYNTTAASLAVLFMVVSLGSVLPIILFFGSLMVGRAIRKKTACNIFFVCVFLMFLIAGLGGVSELGML